MHKVIGKQVSLTRILLSGIFGILSHTLTQLIAEAQDTDNSSDYDYNSHGTQNSNKQKKKLKVTMKHQPRTKSDIQITNHHSYSTMIMMYMLIPTTNIITQQSDHQRKVYNLRILITKVNPVTQRKNPALNLYTKNY